MRGESNLNDCIITCSQLANEQFATILYLDQKKCFISYDESFLSFLKKMKVTLNNVGSSSFESQGGLVDLLVYRVEVCVRSHDRIHVDVKKKSSLSGARTLDISVDF